MAQLMPLPLTVSCFSKVEIGFTFLVPAHLGSPGKGPLNGCVCVCFFARMLYSIIYYLTVYFLLSFEQYLYCATLLARYMLSS